MISEKETGHKNDYLCHPNNRFLFWYFLIGDSVMMKKGLLLQIFTSLLFVSCSAEIMDSEGAFIPSDEVFYATLEPNSDSDTKVYVDDNIKILWDAGDRISIFNKNTLNQQYEFTGETGDNAGAFKKISGQLGTGNPMAFICAVYPYDESTNVSNSGVMTLDLPVEQSYKEGSFGPGANTMVSVSEDNQLKFKNVGGYLVLKFYGKEVAVSSIKLEGNNGERLSGKASISQLVGGNPIVQMTSTSETAITLNCDAPVELGTTKEDAVQFWLVVPPTSFSKGFTLTVTDSYGNAFVKKTTKNLSIDRNKVLRISPIEAVIEKQQPNNEIWYFSSDGEVVMPYNSDSFDSATIISNEYAGGKGVITFDRDVTTIGYRAFYHCDGLTNVSFPAGLTSIGDEAFDGCFAFTGSLFFPAGLKSIGRWAFWGCLGLNGTLTFPAGLTSIGDCAFAYCSELISITVPSETPPVGGEYMFEKTNNCPINVPSESVDIYRAAKYWSDYSNRIQAITK